MRRRDEGPTAGLPSGLVRERAFEEIRDAIVSGRLAPGDRLIERELCESLGIGRASARETIRRLEAERLVTVAPHRGPSVATLSVKEAREIYEIRALVEGLLIAAFAVRATQAEIDALCAIFAQVEEAARGPDIAGIVRLMQRFNAHLLAVVDHALARDLLGQLDARISRLRMRAMAKPGRLAQSLGEYRAVLAAVQARDAALAERRVKRSVMQARDAAVSVIEAEAAESPPQRRRAKRR